jgi:hypothetical protein
VPTPRRAVAAATALLLALACAVGGAIPAAAASPVTSAPSDVPRVFTGQAFDICTAPALGTLRAWRHHSPYGALGIYIGGRNRGCAQPRLNTGWIRSATGMGWRLLPLYAGSQAPCRAGRRSARIEPRRAAATGNADGRDAVRAAAVLNIAPGSPVYLDMESYERDGGRCSLAVLDYTVAWTREVHAAGYLSGFYSSVNGGIADLADLAAGSAHRSVAGSAALPDVIWYARWDRRAKTDGYHALRHGGWSRHQRLHQYEGNKTERYGGVTLSVDRNAVDAPVAIIRTPGRTAGGGKGGGKRGAKGGGKVGGKGGGRGRVPVGGVGGKAHPGDAPTPTPDGE